MLSSSLNSIFCLFLALSISMPVVMSSIRGRDRVGKGRDWSVTVALEEEETSSGCCCCCCCCNDDNDDDDGQASASAFTASAVCSSVSKIRNGS